MSKGSQQQSTTPRDRATSGFPKPKTPGKGDANGASAKPASARESSKPDSTDTALEFAVVPAESAEEDFFARGEVNSSFPPAALDVFAPELDDDAPESVPLTPAQLARRARLRRIVGSVVGAAAVLTAVVGAKALSAPPAKVAASEGSLNVPHQVVPSIAMAAPEEPAAKTTAPEALNVADDPSTPPGDPAAAQNAAAEGVTVEPSAADTAAENSANQPPPAPTVRRLPVIDVEVPVPPDPATDKQWESAAQNLASQDFKGADSAFAELGKRSDTATREAARLARALWWTANGRQNEVKPVIADLAANALTPSVRQQAKDRLRTN